MLFNSFLTSDALFDPTEKVLWLKWMPISSNFRQLIQKILDLILMMRIIRVMRRRFWVNA